ncbi:unnamed protein product [Aureobasidium pullulans]|uniref:Uncharacterized protein n=1 Tax=Aureobasidium pullulans TaxID=5580 RepID=A0A4V4ITJ8_AURPU|nr:hypothetical protein D6D15_10459 [Aureobasidium pullulans]CAD0042089.1 unnamed protein product [Aureobasidium pullulans]
MSLLSFRSSQKTLSSLHKLRAPAVRQTRLASSNSKSASPPADQHNKEAAKQVQSEPPKKPKTQAELDHELRQKMAGMSGDGGDAGVEYEDGVPVSMKRSVKNNMFRYI